MMSISHWGEFNTVVDGRGLTFDRWDGTKYIHPKPFYTTECRRGSDEAKRRTAEFIEWKKMERSREK